MLSKHKMVWLCFFCLWWLLKDNIIIKILSFKKMNTELLKYLQQDGIGKVIAQGLADVYTEKPETPVKYLAAWLKKYSANQK